MRTRSLIGIISVVSATMLLNQPSVAIAPPASQQKADTPLYQGGAEKLDSTLDKLVYMPIIAGNFVPDYPLTADFWGRFEFDSWTHDYRFVHVAQQPGEAIPTLDWCNGTAAEVQDTPFARVQLPGNDVTYFFSSDFLFA